MNPKKMDYIFIELGTPHRVIQTSKGTWPFYYFCHLCKRGGKEIEKHNQIFYEISSLSIDERKKLSCEIFNLDINKFERQNEAKQKYDNTSLYFDWCIKQIYPVIDPAINEEMRKLYIG